MIIKGKFVGKEMIKYGVIFFLIKIVIVVAWVFTVKPYFFDFVNHIESVVNSGVNLDIMFLVTKLFVCIVYFALAILIEAIIFFGIILPIAKEEIKNFR